MSSLFDPNGKESMEHARFLIRRWLTQYLQISTALPETKFIKVEGYKGHVENNPLFGTAPNFQLEEEKYLRQVGLSDNSNSTLLWPAEHRNALKMCLEENLIVAPDTLTNIQSVYFYCGDCRGLVSFGYSMDDIARRLCLESFRRNSVIERVRQKVYSRCKRRFKQDKHMFITASGFFSHILVDLDSIDLDELGGNMYRKEWSKVHEELLLKNLKLGYIEAFPNVGAIFHDQDLLGLSTAFTKKQILEKLQTESKDRESDLFLARMQHWPGEDEVALIQCIRDGSIEAPFDGPLSFKDSYLLGLREKGYTDLQIHLKIKYESRDQLSDIYIARNEKTPFVRKTKADKEWTPAFMDMLINCVRAGFVVARPPKPIKILNSDCLGLSRLGFTKSRLISKVHKELRRKDSALSCAIAQANNATFEEDWATSDETALADCLQNNTILAPKQRPYTFSSDQSALGLLLKFGLEGVKRKIRTSLADPSSAVCIARQKQWCELQTGRRPSSTAALNLISVEAIKKKVTQRKRHLANIDSDTDSTFDDDSASESDSGQSDHSGSIYKDRHKRRRPVYNSVEFSTSKRSRPTRGSTMTQRALRKSARVNKDTGYVHCSLSDQKLARPTRRQRQSGTDLPSASERCSLSDQKLARPTRRQRQSGTDFLSATEQRSIVNSREEPTYTNNDCNWEGVPDFDDLYSSSWADLNNGDAIPEFNGVTVPPISDDPMKSTDNLRNAGVQSGLPPSYLAIPRTNRPLYIPLHSRFDDLVDTLSNHASNYSDGESTVTLKSLVPRENAEYTHSFVIVGILVSKSLGQHTLRKQKEFYICIDVMHPTSFLIALGKENTYMRKLCNRKRVYASRLPDSRQSHTSNCIIFSSPLLRHVVAGHSYGRSSTISDGSRDYYSVVRDWHQYRRIALPIQTDIFDAQPTPVFIQSKRDSVAFNDIDITSLINTEERFRSKGLIPKQLASRQAKTGIRRRGSLFVNMTSAKVNETVKADGVHNSYYRAKLILGGKLKGFGHDVLSAEQLASAFSTLNSDQTLSQVAKDAIAATVYMTHSWRVEHAEPESVVLTSVTFDIDYLSCELKFSCAKFLPHLSFDDDPYKFLTSWSKSFFKDLFGSPEKYKESGVAQSTIYLKKADVYKGVRFQTFIGTGAGKACRGAFDIQLPSVNTGSNIFKVVTRLIPKRGNPSRVDVATYVWDKFIRSIASYLCVSDPEVGTPYNQDNADRHKGADIFSTVCVPGGYLLPLFTMLSMASSASLNEAYDVRFSIETYNGKNHNIKSTISSRGNFEEWKRGVLHKINTNIYSVNDWALLKEEISSDLLLKASNSPYSFIPRYIELIYCFLEFYNIRVGPGVSSTGTLSNGDPALLVYTHIRPKEKVFAEMTTDDVFSPDNDAADIGRDASDDEIEDVDENEDYMKTPHHAPRFPRGWRTGSRTTLYSTAGAGLPPAICHNRVNIFEDSPADSYVDETWRDRNSNIIARRGQSYNGTVRYSTGQINSTLKQSYIAGNLQSATGSVRCDYGRMTNMETVQKTIDDFHSNAADTLERLSNSPARFELICEYSPDKLSAFTKAHFDAQLVSMIAMVVDIFELGLVKGYAAKVYQNTTLFSLSAMRGLMSATLDLTQCNSGVSDMHSCLRQFGVSHGAIRSKYLTFWSGKLELEMSYLAVFERLLHRSLLIPPELVDQVCRLLRRKGATEGAVDKVLLEMGCNLEIRNMLSESIRKHQNKLLDPSRFDENVNSLYSPRPSPERNRICRKCWRIFVSASLRSHEWITPPLFASHPCEEPPDERFLIRMDSAELAQKIEADLEGLGPMQRKVVEQLRTRNVVFHGPPGIGKTHVALLLQEIYSKTYGSEAVIVVSPTLNSAATVRGETIHSRFKFSNEPIELYVFLHMVLGIDGELDVDRNVAKIQEFIRIYYNKKPREDVLRLIFHCVLLVLDEYGRIKYDIFVALHFIFQQIRENRNEMFGGCRILLTGDPSQCSLDRSDGFLSALTDYYKTKGPSCPISPPDFNEDGFGYCFESDLFATSAEYGRPVWIVVRSAATFRFLKSTYMPEFVLRARVGDVNNDDLDVLRTKCNRANLTSRAAYLHLLNLMSYEHHIEFHCGLPLAAEEDFEDVNTRANSETFSTFKGKCYHSNPKCTGKFDERVATSVIFRRTREAFIEGRKWSSQREKVRLLSCLNGLPVSERLLAIGVSENSQITYMNRLLQEMRDLLPAERKLHSHERTVKFHVDVTSADGNIISRSLNDEEVSKISSVNLNSACSTNVDACFLEHIDIFQDEIYRLSMMDRSENPFVPPMTFLNVIGIDSSVEPPVIIARPCSHDKVTFFSDIRISPKSRKYIFNRHRSRLNLPENETLYVTVTQYPLIYPSAMTLDVMGGLTLKNGVALANGLTIQKGAGIVGVTRAPDESDLLIQHVPRDVDEANSHDFAPTNAFKVLEAYLSACLGTVLDGVVDRPFYLKAKRSKGSTRYEVVDSSRQSSDSISIPPTIDFFRYSSSVDKAVADAEDTELPDDILHFHMDAVEKTLSSKVTPSTTPVDVFDFDTFSAKCVSLSDDCRSVGTNDLGMVSSAFDFDQFTDSSVAVIVTPAREGQEHIEPSSTTSASAQTAVSSDDEIASVEILNVTPTASSIHQMWDKNHDPVYWDDLVLKGFYWEHESCALDTQFTTWLSAARCNVALKSIFIKCWGPIGPMYKDLFNRHCTFGEFKHRIISLWRETTDLPLPRGMRFVYSDIRDCYESYLTDEGAPLLTRFFRLRGKCSNPACSKPFVSREMISPSTCCQFVAGRSLIYSIEKGLYECSNSKVCTTCGTKFPVTAENTRLPWILDIKPTSPTSQTSYVPSIERFIDVNCFSDNVRYELSSIVLHQGCHFTSIVNLHGRLYFYDGMRKSGRMEYFDEIAISIDHKSIRRVLSNPTIVMLVYVRYNGPNISGQNLQNVSDSNSSDCDSIDTEELESLNFPRKRK